MSVLAPRTDLIRLAGLGIWLSVGLFLPLCTDPFASPVATAICYFGFGVMFWWATEPAAGRSDAISLALLAGQSVLALLLLRTHPYFLMTALLVICGWQVALRLPWWRALAWIVGQSVIGGLLLRGELALPLLVSSCGTAIGFQLFALVTADLARREAAARRALDAALVQLQATQQVLLVREREQERLRIARDLHDDLGHGLTAIGLMAARAEVTIADAGARDFARDMKREAAALLRHVRATVRGLRAPGEEVGRPDAPIDLTRALAPICAAAELPFAVSLSIDPALSHLAADTGVVIARLVREALTNAARHGRGASNVAVNVCDRGKVIEVIVGDDGAGAASIHFGNGLAGMRERVAALGGELSLQTSPGCGYRVTAQLPVLTIR